MHSFCPISDVKNGFGVVDGETSAIKGDDVILTCAASIYEYETADWWILNRTVETNGKFGYPFDKIVWYFHQSITFIDQRKLGNVRLHIIKHSIASQRRRKCL